MKIFKKWWFWVLAIIGFFILIGILSPSSEESKSKSAKDEAKTYSVGEDVKVKDIRWKVISAEDKGDTLKGTDSKYPDYEKDKKATGNSKFIKLTMEVENQSKDMKSVSDLKIKDDQGREFTHSSDVISWIPEDKEIFILSNLNPNVTQQFIDYYEVPKDAKGFKITVGDLEMFSNKSAEINLGI